MIHSIGNDYLTVEVAEKGAELQSVRGRDGTEYLWQGDEKYWADRALNIFPFVARLNEGRYRMDGEEHSMSIHGFVPTTVFSADKRSENCLVMSICDDRDTFRTYPRKFVFSVIYSLEENRLNVTYEVENRDTRTMYFGLGGHPGFNVPLKNGLSFEDYHLRFNESREPIRVGFSESCFVNGTDTPFPLENGNTLPLKHDLFDNDAIVLRETAKTVTLETGKDCHSVTVSFPQMPYLGLWHRPKTDAPYLCIEPWSSLPAEENVLTVFEEKKDLLHLNAGESYTNSWSITIR